MSLKTAIMRFISPEYLIKPELVRGPLPSAKEAYPKFFKLALPAMIELVLIQLIGIADTIMVGEISPAAITAVGITAQPTMLILSLFFALNIGVTAVVARRKGEERQTDANTVLRMAIILAVIFGTILSTLGVIFAKPLLQLAGAKPEVIGDSTTYFQIVGCVLMPRAVTLAISAAQRGTGNTKVSMRINLSANVVNVFFNFLLISGRLGFPALGVKGAAIATAIGNIVGFILALLSLTGQKRYLHFEKGQSWKPDKDALTAIAKISSNAILEQAVLRVGFFTFARIVSELGVNEYATHVIVMQALGLSFTFADGLGVGATALVGQNMGAGRPDISAVYGKVAQRIAMCVSAVLLAVFVFLGGFIVDLFTDDAEIIRIGTTLMIFAGCCVPVQTSAVVMSGSLRGAGDTKYVARVMLLTVGILRPVLGFVLTIALGLGLYGAWTAIFIDITCRLIFTFARFSTGKWFEIKV